MISGLIIISILSSLFFLPLILTFLESNSPAINYNNKKVLNCAGVYFTIEILLFCMYLMLVKNTMNLNDDIKLLYVIIGVLSASFTGYMDDRSKDTPKGFTGHIKSLFQGRITAGMIKAIVSFFISLIICIISDYKNIDFLINVAIISLTQNFFNLLDLRPGRALKVYLFFSMLLFLIFDFSNLYILLNTAIIISILIYMPYELKEICMLGDTGSNALGIFLGIFISSISHTGIRFLFLLFLFYVHIYSERKSISEFISSNQLLNFIDSLGRVKNYDDAHTKRGST
ncbi:hypothetical protein OXPF_13590 [Oxobacter pfennigii]|uniref:Phospho-N-acetylmuramoyl-pentapeptide-transferase n=2 Tax=Oxobacter pfennigii TaxID=36849 RepID=A0A0P8WQR3_9CLOT|nr:hypothetical protein OXPF_13590 [Oxobacter pfennigii]